MIGSPKLNCLSPGIIIRPRIAVGGNGNGFCAEFQTVYDSWTTKPADADAAEMNTMVEKMVADGVWALFDVFYVFAIHTNGASEALVNWINPGTNDATLVNAPAFVAFEGFTGANTKYINTNFNANAEGVNYVLDDASVGIYIRNNVAENTRDIGARQGVNTIQILSRFLTNLTHYRINSAITDSVANLDSRGLYIATRSAANAIKCYRNKVEVVNAATVSSAIPNLEVYLLCYNLNGVPSDFCTRQMSIAYLGGNMDEGGSSDVTNLTDAFEAWMDYKGKGVIP